MNLRQLQFDTEICPRCTLQDISADAVRWYMSRLRSSGRYEYVSESLPIYEALGKLGVLIDVVRDSDGQINANSYSR